MRLLYNCLSSNSLSDYHGISRRILRVLSFSTQPQAFPAPNDTLYRRILPAGDPRVSIVPILDQWINEGKTVNENDFKTAVKFLRKYKRFAHALQLSEWMHEKMYLERSPGNVAVQLDLISKVYSLEQAEKYFSSIPDALRTYHIYGALLSCYAHSNSLEKAEDLMQKMRELGFLRSSLPYNVMLNLYAKMGKHEKLDALFREMEEKGMSGDKATFYIRLNAYASAGDTEGMEKLLTKMKADPQLFVDWNAYAVAAKGYLKAGLVEKTSTMLKKFEQHIRGKARGFAYDILLTMYASLGNKVEVYRIWNLRKGIGTTNNMAYFRVISSLVKLDDINGAEKILEEWESVNTSYDFRIPNLLVNAYCKKGLLERAEVFVDEAIKRGKEPIAGTWDHLATAYCRTNQMAQAMESMKKAILARPRGWKLNRVTLSKCLEYLKNNEGLEVAEEFTRLLNEQRHILRIPIENDGESDNFALNVLHGSEGGDKEVNAEIPAMMELR